MSDHIVLAASDILGSTKVKKCKNLYACQDLRVTFTQLCVSVDGMLIVLRLSFSLRDWVTSWLKGGRDPIVW